MQSYTLTQLKENLGAIFSSIKKKPVFITRYNKKYAVILSFEQYQQLKKAKQTVNYDKIQTISQIIKYLEATYPGKNIVLNRNKNGEVVEIICEIYNGPDFSKAIAIIIKGSLLHYHKTLTETYYILHGQLRAWKNNKEYIIPKGETITFKPYEQHKTEGHLVWLEVYSQPGWQLNDHILVEFNN